MSEIVVIKPVGPVASAEPREVRFDLASLLAEASEELRSGAFGLEQLNQDDMRKIVQDSMRRNSK